MSGEWLGMGGLGGRLLGWDGPCQEVLDCATGLAGSPSNSAAEVRSRFGRSGQAEPATGCGAVGWLIFQAGLMVIFYVIIWKLNQKETYIL